MYGMHLFSSVNRSFTVKLKNVFLSVRYIQKNVPESKVSLDLKSKVSNDVVLFNFENTRTFLFMNVFSTIHCVTWTYLGVFLFETLDKLKSSNLSEKKSGRSLDLEKNYGTVLSMSAIVFGWIFFSATCFYTVRSVRKIILHKGGREITLMTYNLPGYNTIKIPLNNMSSFEHRAKAKRYIPIKIKNKLFYYLIDIRGEFLNPALFDLTAGLKRTL